MRASGEEQSDPAGRTLLSEEAPPGPRRSILPLRLRRARLCSNVSLRMLAGLTNDEIAKSRLHFAGRENRNLLGKTVTVTSTSLTSLNINYVKPQGGDTPEQE